MIWVLKIEKRFWDLIQDGRKHRVVRKLDKSYIRHGDTVMFTDMKSESVFGFCSVDETETLEYDQVFSHVNLDKETQEYVRENYNQETHLHIMFTRPVDVRFSSVDGDTMEEEEDGYIPEEEVKEGECPVNYTFLGIGSFWDDDDYE